MSRRAQQRNGALKTVKMVSNVEKCSLQLYVFLDLCLNAVDASETYGQMLADFLAFVDEQAPVASARICLPIGGRNQTMLANRMPVEVAALTQSRRHRDWRRHARKRFSSGDRQTTMFRCQMHKRGRASFCDYPLGRRFLRVDAAVDYGGDDSSNRAPLNTGDGALCDTAVGVGDGDGDGDGDARAKYRLNMCAHVLKSERRRPKPSK